MIDEGNFGWPFASFQVKNVTQDAKTNMIHVRQIIVTILLVSSNIDLHYLAGPHKNKLEQSAQAVPIVQKNKNFLTAQFEFDDVASFRTMLPLKNEITMPITKQAAQHLILVLSGNDLHKLSFFQVFSANVTAPLSIFVSASPFFLLPNIFILIYI